MRTTLALDEALGTRAPAAAARDGGPRDGGPLAPLPVVRGGTGLMPGIDPLSNASRDEAMDAEEDARRIRIAHGEAPDGPA